MLEERGGEEGVQGCKGEYVWRACQELQVAVKFTISLQGR